jgi:hypothetical protein
MPDRRLASAPPFRAYLQSAPHVQVEWDHEPPEVVWMPDADGYATNANEIRWDWVPQTRVYAVCVRDATGRQQVCVPAVEQREVGEGDSLVIPAGQLVARPMHWA